MKEDIDAQIRQSTKNTKFQENRSQRVVLFTERKQQETSRRMRRRIGTAVLISIVVWLTLCQLNVITGIQVVVSAMVLLFAMLYCGILISRCVSQSFTEEQKNKGENRR
jgi:Flp pilus assembly protein TadB